MRFLGMRTLTRFLAGQPPRARRVDLQALLERVPPAGHRAGGRHPRRRRHGADRPRAGVVVPDRRRRRAQRQRVVGRRRSSSPAPARSTPAPSQVQRNIIGEMVLGLPKEPGLATRHVAGAAAAEGVSRSLRWPAPPSPCWPTRALGHRGAQVLLLAPAAGGARPPFLPAARSAPTCAFRLQTAYGDPDHEPEPRRRRDLPPLVPGVADVTR